MTGASVFRLPRLAVAFIALAALFVVSAPPAEAQQSPYFGTGGIVTTDIGADDTAYAIAVQSDGKIVVAGEARKEGEGRSLDFALARYNADGSLDTSFSGDGKVTTDFSSRNLAFALAVQPDRKIVVAGAAVMNVVDFALARYNADGSLDTSFSGDGKVTTDFASGDDRAWAVAVQPNRKIVAAGYSHNGTDYDFALARYNPDGSLDTSFGGDGKVTTPIGSARDRGYAMAVQSDGKIVVAGDSTNASGNNDFAVARYNTDGSLDTSFSSDGKVTTAFASDVDQAWAVAVQPDGKIVAAGHSSSNGTTFDIALARYNSDGSLDTSFSGDGKVTTDISGSHDDTAYAMALQSNGRIVVAGRSNSDGMNEDFAVARYNANGSLDTSFSRVGYVTTPIGSDYERAWAMALQSDGKIVVAGYSNSGTQVDVEKDFALARYTANGSLDAPLPTLSVEATPACGTRVTDTSVVPKTNLVLTPAPAMAAATEIRSLTDTSQTAWFETGRPIDTSGRSPTVTHGSFAALRRGHNGFAGLEWRLKDTPNVTAECTWQFGDDDGEPPPVDDPPPTGGTPPPPPPPLPPTVSLSVSPNPVTEGVGVTVTAALSRALSGEVTIPLAVTRDTSEPGDHGTLSEIAVAAGETSGTGTIATHRDADPYDETFTVALGTLPSQVRAGSPASVTVRIDDDAVVGAAPAPEVAFFPGASGALSGLAWVVNRSASAGTVRIRAFDDAGTEHPAQRLTLGAGFGVGFKPADLEEGNPDKGLTGTGAGAGDWRLVFESDLDLRVLGLVRQPDGGLAPVHATAPGSAAGGYAVAFFNPASNRGLLSRLRLVNRSGSEAAVTLTGTDSAGQPGESAVTLTLPARAACTLSAPVLESGAWGDTGPAAGCEALTGALGDGAGKWRLVVTSDQPLAVMSLLGSAAGHLTNLSSVPAGAEAGVHRLALLPPADDPLRQGFVRLVNRSDEAGTVTLRAFDDAGTAYPAQTLALSAGQAMHFTARDLEEGHADKGLSGTGDGAGSWQLVFEPEPADLDLQALSLVRNPDMSSVAALHDTAPGSAEGAYEVAFFNPASNRGLSSRLRLVNRAGSPAAVRITGTDSAGQPGESAVTLTLPARAACTLGAPVLESGAWGNTGPGPGCEALTGALGDGAGKWRLRVSADQPLAVMSLLRHTASGALANLSTARE